MHSKRTVSAVLMIFLVLSMNSVSHGLTVDTSKIDKVRDKLVLNEDDNQIVDSFVEEAVRALVRTKDFAEVARTRTIILSRQDSGRQSAAEQYADQFSASAQKYISGALVTAGTLTPPERSFKVILNLLILIDGLEDIQLARLAIGCLNHEKTAIRYWAVHCLTNPGFTKKLNLPDNLRLASDIVEQLKKMVEKSTPEESALIAEFASKLKSPAGEVLLLQAADVRIKKYADWTVDYELLDVGILKLLYDKVSVGGVNSGAVGQRFGQLYSYAMQRYIQNIEDGNFLSAAQKSQLVSVLVEVEKCCLWKLLGTRQTIIKRAVEQKNTDELLAEYGKLFGNESQIGALAEKLNFDYGEKPDGSKRISPVVLPPRP